MKTNFDRWWDSDYDDVSNPYKKGTPAYWAWAGWQAYDEQPVDVIHTPKPERTETIELDLTDQELLVLFKLAHERDVTFNDFVEIVLTDYLEQIEYDNLLNKLDGPSEPRMVQNTWPYPEAD